MDSTGVNWQIITIGYYIGQRNVATTYHSFLYVLIFHVNIFICAKFFNEVYIKADITKQNNNTKGKYK